LIERVKKKDQIGMVIVLITQCNGSSL